MHVTKETEKTIPLNYQITTQDIKLALLEYCRFDRQWAAVDECLNADIVADSGSFIVEIEIKISKIDLLHGEKKKADKHKNFTTLEFPDFIPNKYLFCVPIGLKDITIEYAKQLNPKYGVIVFDDIGYFSRLESFGAAKLSTFLLSVHNCGFLHDNYNKKHSEQIAKRASSKLITYMQREDEKVNNNVKSKRLVIPVDEKEHDEITEYVNKSGFDSASSFIRSLIRADMRRDKRL